MNEYAPPVGQWAIGNCPLLVPVRVSASCGSLRRKGSDGDDTRNTIPGTYVHTRFRAVYRGIRITSPIQPSLSVQTTPRVPDIDTLTRLVIVLVQVPRQDSD